MDWDQWLFTKIDTLGRKTATKIKSRNLRNKGYLQYSGATEATRWNRYFYLLTGVSAELVCMGKRFSFNGKKLVFPENLFLLQTKETGDLFLRVAVMLLGCRLATGKEKFFYNARYALRSYPGAHLLLKSLFEKLKRLKQDDPAHYRRLSLLLTHATAMQPQHLPELSGATHKEVQNQPQYRATIRKNAELNEAQELIKDQKKITEYTLGHNFEKIETAEEFGGQWRDIDDSAESTEQEIALREIQLKYFIRSDDVCHSTLENDQPRPSSVEISATEGGAKFCYDEWDFHRQRYRRAHCALWEKEAKSEGPVDSSALLNEHRNLLVRLEKRLTALRNIPRNNFREKSGTEFDLDAIVDRYTILRAQQTPDDRVYIQQQKKDCDITLLLLLDISLSTDSWLGGRRIIDAERISLLLFAEALDRLQIPFQMHAFCSRTRNQNYFFRIKAQHERWLKCRNRLANLQPMGYTRIGPALRHAGSLLATAPERDKWIVLLTDCRPNDYDRYEGRYGEQDIRQVNRELIASGIRLYTLAFMLHEKPTISRMFSPGRYRILQHPRQLLDSLEDFLRAAAF